MEWVGALRTLGLTASARENELEVQLNVRTDPEGLSDEDLPIAAGDEAPPVLSREGEVGVGIRDPGQIVQFAEAAGRLSTRAASATTPRPSRRSTRGSTSPSTTT